VRYVSARLGGSIVLVEKVEDGVARKASDPAARLVHREDSCSYACCLVIIC
jgi:hypothetical protein